MKNLILPIAIGVCILAAAVYAQTTYTNTKLAAVDSTKPLGSAIISQGDDEIRALKAALLDWADDEHLLTGAHATNFFRQYMAGTNSIPGYAVSNLTVNSFSTGFQKPLIYISSVETNMTLASNTTNMTQLAWVVVPSNGYTKVMIEADVWAKDHDNTNGVVYDWFFSEGTATSFALTSTNRTWTTRTEDDGNVQEIHHLSWIGNGGQSTATTNSVFVRMNQRSADVEARALNIRLWGIP